MAYQAWSVVYGEQPSATKWNVLGSNDAHFYNFVGDTNAAQNYTPTIKNLSGSNNTIVGDYVRIGNVVHAQVSVVIGAGFSIAGNMEVSSPFSNRFVSATAGRAGGVNSVFYDVSAGTRYVGTGRWFSDTSVLILAMLTNATYVTTAGITSSVPFAWASGDAFRVQFMYEAVEA